VRYKITLLTIVLVGGLAIMLSGTRQVSAQGPGGGRGRIGFISPLMCSTTDYTAVAAKALSMTASELRVSLVSGKTLQDLATSKNVSIDTVRSALDAAFKADVDQAVKDGLITQEVANAMGTAQGLRDRRGPRLPIPFFGERGGLEIRLLGGAYGVSAHNVVRPYVVAAQAIGMTCPELAKELAQGNSIVQVATTKNVQVQKVIDALVKAHQDAAAADVKEGLITQAQADARNLRLVERVTSMISQRGGMMFGRIRGMLPGMPRDGRPGRPGQQATPPATPPATPAVQ
jgi:hypothetical protein